MTGIEDEPDKKMQDAWLFDPANYRRKIFYYNPKDKRILPRRRIRSVGLGINGLGLPPNGWVINFANPYSIIAAVLITLTPVVLILLFV